MENCWGQLDQLDYAERKQYSTVEDFKIAINGGRGEIFQKNVKKLNESLPKRMCDVVKNKGM